MVDVDAFQTRNKRLDFRFISFDASRSDDFLHVLVVDGLAGDHHRPLEEIIKLRPALLDEVVVAHPAFVEIEFLAALRAATLADLQAVNDIGPIVAESVFAFLREEDNAALIARLAAAGLTLHEETTARGGPLEGLSIVVTGSLDRWSRNEVEELITRLEDAQDDGR